MLGRDNAESEVDFVFSSIFVVDQACTVGANTARLSRREIGSTVQYIGLLFRKEGGRRETVRRNDLNGIL